MTLSISQDSSLLTKEMFLKTSSLKISSIFNESSNEDRITARYWGWKQCNSYCSKKNNDRNKIALQYAQLNLSISFLFFLQCLIAF